MSHVYLLEPDSSNFQSLVTYEDDYYFFEMVTRFDGTPIGADWKTIDVEYDSETANLPVGDYPCFGHAHIPIFSLKAVAALHSHLVDSGELLPVRCGSTEYVAFNVTRLSSALNTELSEIVRFSDGRIMDIKSYTLVADRLESDPIFKLTETPLMDVFVSDEFVNAVESAGLQGFLFNKVEVQ